MAEKRTIDININTNADEASKEFDRFGKAVNTADKSVTDLNKTFEEVYGEIAPLTTRMGEAEDRLYELAAAGDTASAEYQGLLTKVGEYRKVQIQTDLAVDQAAGTLGQKLGGALSGATAGFAAVQGTMALVGGESEELEKTLLKVQSAMAIQQGVQGVLDYSKSIGLAGKATKVFNLIVKANPLAILATVIIAIIGYFAIFTDAIDVAIQGFKDLTDWIGLTNNAEQEKAEAQKKRAKAQEERIKAEDKIEKKIAAERRERLQQEIQLYKQKKRIEEEDFQRNLAFQESQGKSTARLRKAKVLERIEDAKGRAKLLKGTVFQKESQRTLIELRTELNNINKEIREQSKAASEEKQDNIQKEIDLRQEQLDTEIDEEIALQQTLDEIQRENEDRFRTEQENELLLVQEKYDALEASAQGNAEALEQIDIARLNERNDINLKYDTEAYDAKKALDDQAAADKKAAEDKEISDNKALQDSKVQMANDAFGAISGLVTAFAGESEKSQRKAFKINKAISIAQAVINTAGAIGAAINPAVGGLGIPAGIPGAALAAATGIAQVATIAKTEFGGGSTGDVSPAGALAESQAPNFNVVGDSGVNQLASLQQQPTQAYVVSGDVTTAQALDRNRIQNATL